MPKVPTAGPAAVTLPTRDAVNEEMRRKRAMRASFMIDVLDASRQRERSSCSIRVSNSRDANSSLMRRSRAGPLYQIQRLAGRKIKSLNPNDLAWVGGAGEFSIFLSFSPTFFRNPP